MRATIYTRVSSAEQVEGFSLDAQRELCESFARSRGWNIVNVYVEEGVSAKTTTRPAFQRMLAAAERRAFDVIIVHKLDRFSRKLKDVLALVDQLEQYAVSLVSVSQNFDFTTPSGRLMLSMLGALAQWDNDNRAEETKKGQRERRNQGGWMGNLSFGYSTPARIKRTLLDSPSVEVEEQLKATLSAYPNVGDSAAIPHPIDSQVVRIIFDLYATGRWSYNGIATKLNTDGHRITGRFNSDRFRADNIRTILLNRFYTGEIPAHAGNRGHLSLKQRDWMKGNHEAIVSAALFDKVQGVMQSRNAYANNDRSARTVYYWSGLVVDATGVYWKGVTQGNGRAYKRSPAAAAEWHGNKSIRASIIDDQMLQVLGGMALSQDVHNRVLASYRPPTPRPRLRPASERIERIKELFIEGHITKEEFLRRKAEIELQVDESSQVKREYSFEEIKPFVEMLANLGDLWSEATDDERAELAQLLFSKIEVGVRFNQVVVEKVYLSPLASLFIGEYRNGVYYSGGGEPHQIRLLAIAA